MKNVIIITFLSLDGIHPEGLILKEREG